MRVIPFERGSCGMCQSNCKLFYYADFHEDFRKTAAGADYIFDYIVGITIGSFAASLTVDLSSSAWPHWVGIATWIVLGVLLQKVSLKSKNISEYINDSPVVVVHDGKIMGDNLKNSKFTMNEFLQQLRLKEIFDVNEVKFAIIETNGQISTLKKMNSKPY